jgi:hypothetical protein
VQLRALLIIADTVCNLFVLAAEEILEVADQGQSLSSAVGWESIPITDVDMTAGRTCSRMIVLLATDYAMMKM